MENTELQPLKNVETLSWVTPQREQNTAVTLADFVDGALRMIDQTLLPSQLVEIECRDIASIWEAIKMLRVRGAPAIGIAAAYGVCVGLAPLFHNGNTPSTHSFDEQLQQVTEYLASSRPTAVNLFWALDRMKRVALALSDSTPGEIAVQLLEEAKKIHQEDRDLCRAMGRFGASLVKDGDSLLTHCNAGGLATADYGTALAVFFTATAQGKKIRVFADETRPLLQGARLTAWELQQRGIDVTLICDSMAAMIMKQGKINAVFVGADRIAANGDTANKIGTYSVAICAKAHQVPFYVVAPSTTFDLSLNDGNGIPIELRDPEEIRRGFGKQMAPDEIEIYNPAFDVTPAELITGMITEHGIVSPVTKENIVAVLNRKTECEA